MHCDFGKSSIKNIFGLFLESLNKYGSLKSTWGGNVNRKSTVLSPSGAVVNFG